MSSNKDEEQKSTELLFKTLITLPFEIVKKIFVKLDDQRKIFLLDLSMIQKINEKNNTINYELSELTINLLSIKNIFNNFHFFFSELKKLKNGQMKYWIKYVNQDIIIFTNEEEYKEFIEYKKKNHCENLGYRWYFSTENFNIPYGVTHVTFGFLFRQPIKKGDLPDSIISITFDGPYNIELGKDVFPENLKYLDLGNFFNKPFGKGTFPKKLTHLILGNWYKQSIEKDILPESLTHLTAGTYYEHLIKWEKVLPIKVKYLMFEDRMDCIDREIAFNLFWR